MFTNFANIMHRAKRNIFYLSLFRKSDDNILNRTNLALVNVSVAFIWTLNNHFVCTPKCALLLAISSYHKIKNSTFYPIYRWRSAPCVNCFKISDQM